ncbi:MAG: tetratricopeptide repeat protein [Syntrophobacterales bacterium]|nr:MAG: tetratricopeptide repeat protein [Syntrophobacterales bacterium]
MKYKSITNPFFFLFLFVGCSFGHLGLSPSKIQTICDREADFYLEQGDWDKAIDSHEQVIQDNPHFALAHYHLGYAYGFKGMHEREIEEYEKAVQLGLKKFDLFYNLGMTYAEYLRDYDKALKVFKQAERMDSKNDEIHYALGLAYWFKEAESEAVTEFMKTINLNPRHIEAHALLGEIYFRREQYDFAKAEWERVLELDPNNEMARKRLEEIRVFLPR